MATEGMKQFQPLGIGLLPRKLTAKEAENRRAYESHVLQTAIAGGVAISDCHTKATYNAPSAIQGIQILGDHPVTCPLDGSRTDWIDNPDGSQTHTCLLHGHTFTAAEE